MGTWQQAKVNPPPSDRMTGNGFKLKDGGFRLDTRKKFFMIRVVKNWHRLPKKLLTGWVSDQHDLFEDDSAYGKGVGLDDHQSSLPAQNILWFYDKSLM